MVTNVLESLFPFLFLFGDFSFEKGFPSVWILLIILTVGFQSYKFYKKNYLYCFNILEKSRQILAGLQENKSSPEEIEGQLNMSKSAFKKAVGILYKSKKITLGRGYIELISRASS